MTNRRPLPKVDFESGEGEPSPIRRFHLLPLIIGVLGFAALYSVVVYGFSNKFWEPPLYAVLIPEILIYMGLAGSFFLLIWDIVRRDDLGIGIITFGIIFYLSLIFILPYIAIWSGPDRRDSLAEIVAVLRQPLTEHRLRGELTNVKASDHFVFFTDSPTRITVERMRRLEEIFSRVSKLLGTPSPPDRIKIYLPARDVRFGVNRGSIYAASYDEIGRYLVHMALYLGPGYTPVQILYEGIGRALDGRKVDRIHKEARDILRTGLAPPLSHLIPYRRWHHASTEELERAKRLSGSFVRYLIDQYDIGSFKSLFGRATESTVKKRFKRIYGADFRSYEKRWLTFIATEYCDVPPDRATDQPWLKLQLLKIDAYENRKGVQPQIYLDLGMPPEEKWATLSPLSGKEADEVEREFAEPSNIEEFHGRFGRLRETRWRKHRDRYEDGFITFRMKKGRSGYAFVFAVSRDEREGLLRFGCMGRAKVYLNGNPILNTAGKSALLDSDSVPIKLRLGENPILIRISGEGEASFILRITAMDGGKLDGLEFKSPIGD
ncbi:hypothetical protein J7M22_00845 [Candidatus Poribacteria bacterium]|nr:hypothetical protein [Candidatus Poribacteria bacterium]